MAGVGVTFGDWQKFLDRSMKEIVNNGQDDVLSQFKNLVANEDRIDWVQKLKVLECSWILKYFEDVCHIKSTKDAQFAAACRLEGNKSYQMKDYKQAVHLYTKCIVHAPQLDNNESSKEFSLGLGNRSALFYQTKDYTHCLTDAQLSLDHGYPSELRYRLHQRRAQCFLQLQQPEAAEAEFEAAKTSIDLADNLDLQSKVKLLDEIEICIKKIPRQKSTPSSLENNTSLNNGAVEDNEQRSLEGIADGGVGVVLKQASSSIDLMYSKEKGRHLVANRPIKPGEVLIVERPYTAVLLPDYYNTRCLHCFAALVATIPCMQCCVVRYCSERCRVAAWNSYHSVECLLDDLLMSVGVAHLGLRLIVVTGLDFLRKFRESLRSKAEPSWIESGALPSVYECNYETVYQLMPHDEDMQLEDLLQYTLTASLLLKCLEVKGFFQKVVTHSHSNPVPSDITSLDCSHSDIQLYVGGLLLRHICQLVCNAHAITDCELTQLSSSSLVGTVSQVRIATAIYPTASLMNHSCQPTIISSFRGNVLTVRAVTDVKAGDEIFNCYGPHCKHMCRSERQEHLREQYFFTCRCIACTQEFKQELALKALKCTRCRGPMVANDDDVNVMNGTSLDVSGYKVPAAKTVALSIYMCPDCGYTAGEGEMDVARRAVIESNKLFISGLRHLHNSATEDALRLFQRCLSLRQEHVYKHNKDLSEVQDALARCHASKGDFLKASELLCESIQTVEAIYGSTSIELANELQKFSEVCVRAQRRNDALTAVDRAVNIYSLNYGPDCTAISELKQLKQYLTINPVHIPSLLS